MQDPSDIIKRQYNCILVHFGENKLNRILLLFLKDLFQRGLVGKYSLLALHLLLFLYETGNMRRFAQDIVVKFRDPWN